MQQCTTSGFIVMEYHEVLRRETCGAGWQRNNIDTGGISLKPGAGMDMK